MGVVCTDGATDALVSVGSGGVLSLGTSRTYRSARGGVVSFRTGLTVRGLSGPIVRVIGTSEAFRAGGRTPVREGSRLAAITQRCGRYSSVGIIRTCRTAETCSRAGSALVRIERSGRAIQAVAEISGPQIGIVCASGTR